MLTRSSRNGTTAGAAIHLTRALIWRQTTARYRGAALGLLWSLLTPMFMLAVYTFVFGAVFSMRWTDTATAPTTGESAVIFFAGLIVFQIYTEVITQAPSLIVSHRTLVKKVVFPLEILVPVTLGTALLQALASSAVLLVFRFCVYGSVPWTALLAPLVISPMCLMLLGLGWTLSSIGTFMRDIGQMIGPLVTATMFVTPIFYPVSALPQWLQPYVLLNPIALPVVQTREVLVFGNPPNVIHLALYTGAAALVAVLGYMFFQLTRKGFADVL